MGCVRFFGANTRLCPNLLLVEKGKYARPSNFEIEF